MAQEVERSSTDKKIGGLITDFSTPHVNVSLGKTINPKLLLVGVNQSINQSYLYSAKSQQESSEGTIYVEQV